eukprot:SAG31_NODE_4540_length_3153_cov_3.328422_1_plen_501_part_00
MLLSASQLLVCCLPLAAVAAQAAAQVEPPGRCPTAADIIARGTQQICGSAPVADSLKSVGLHIQLDDDRDHGAAPLLEEHGFRTALDLRLLDVAGAEAVELMEELRQGGVSIGDRSKVRLLLGEPAGDCCSTRRFAAAPEGEPATMASSADHCFVRRRQLQEETVGSGGGMSTDTIAIVLSLLVGTAGYLVQAHTARRAEQNLAEQAQEQHVRELARQREHEQMLAQIARTDRAVDECCRPIQAVIEGMKNARYQFVSGMVPELEGVAPEAVAQMLEKSERTTGQFVNEKGQMVSKVRGRVLWDAAEARPDGLVTRAVTGPVLSCASAAASVLGMSDLFSWASQPYCRELPTAIIDHLAADPTVPLARHFRLHVCHSLLPAMRRVQELLDAHGAVVEGPPVAWMKEQFPNDPTGWKLNPTTLFQDNWYGRKHAWEVLVAEWASGDVSAVVPPGAFLPLAGLKAINEYAITRGQQLQRELIGCEASPHCLAPDDLRVPPPG